MTDINVTLECHDGAYLLVVANHYTSPFHATITGINHVVTISDGMPFGHAVQPGTYTVTGTFADGAVPIYPNGQTVTLGANTQCQTTTLPPVTTGKTATTPVTTVATPSVTTITPTGPQTTVPVLTVPVIPTTILHVATSTLIATSVKQSSNTSTTSVATSSLPPTGNNPPIVLGSFILGLGVLATMIGRYCNRKPT